MHLSLGRSARRAAALGVLVCAFVLGACESTTTLVTTPDPGGISVSGTGTVSVAPDVAVISLGVEVRAQTVAAAREGAAKALEAVRASLKRNGVEDRDIKTQGLSINPEYASRPTSQPTIIGYVVANQVSIKVRKLDDASKVLDDAVLAGGDSVRVNGISFDVDQPEKYHAQARELAVKDARQRAEALAKLAGVELGKPRTINEFSGPTSPVPAIARSGAGLADTATPISAGESEVAVQVSIVYELR